MSNSTGRSTTATIRNILDKNLALDKQVADKAARAAGKKTRQKKTSNPAPVKPCPYCVSQNSYDVNEPHASRASKKCPGYILNKKDYIQQELGNNFQRFVIKTGLDASLLLAQPAKDIFLRLIRETVNNYRLIAIKSQLFASYYVRLCLSEGIALSPILFTQAFFYACIQKILGREISNTNINLPRAHMNTVFLRFNIEFPDCHVEDSVHANALAAMANSSATCFVNHVSETYQRNLRNYVQTRIKEVFVS